MNTRPFVQRNVLPIIVLVFVSIALIAWGGQRQTPPQTTKQGFTDTIPKKKTDKKIRDLDEAIEELDNADLKVDMEKISSQIQDAMKQIDMAKVQMEVEKAI